MSSPIIFPTGQLILSDSTLRDGSHAIRHQLSAEDISGYCKIADQCGLYWIEVGHGNGLGASSNHIGESLISDSEALKAARENLSTTKLSVHIMPGIASIERDILPAIDIGVDVFRIASHCTEANTTHRYLEFIRKRNKFGVGVLMMSHMASPIEFARQAKSMEDNGAQAIMLMDSAGTLRTDDIKIRFETLKEILKVPVGIHAHNNLGLATSNTLQAVESGAQIIDACAGGFGAGAGNAQMEIVMSLLNADGKIKIDSSKYFKLVDFALQKFIPKLPTISTLSISTGLSGLFSGYLNPIIDLSNRFNVDPYDVIRILGERKVVAGQEDVVLEVVENLSLKQNH